MPIFTVGLEKEFEKLLDMTDIETLDVKINEIDSFLALHQVQLHPFMRQSAPRVGGDNPQLCHLGNKSGKREVTRYIFPLDE